MNQISWRHHFIPQFYLKGFTNIKGTFKIYDIKQNRFLRGGKDFYPESYFFEKDGNSLINESGKFDLIEKHYKTFDNQVAEVFNKINSSSPIKQYSINQEDIALLQMFVGVLYWRIPSSFEEIKDIVERNKLKELGLKLVNLQGEAIDDSEIEKRLKRDMNFFKSVKFFYPLNTYPELYDCNTPIYIEPAPDGLPSICSDYPIICRDPSTFRVYSDDFIFPLTSKILFVRGEKFVNFTRTVKKEIDLLIFKQAQKYVSCTDENYIYELEEIYQKSNKNLNDLRLSIFRQILNYTT